MPSCFPFFFRADNGSFQRHRSLLLKGTPRNCPQRHSPTTLTTFTLSRSVSETSPRSRKSSARRTACSNQAGPSPVWNSTRSQIPYLRSMHSSPLLHFPPDQRNTVPRVYDQYSFSVIPLLGTILAGDRASYQYLVESIRRFPSQSDFARMISDAGFAVGGDFEGDGGAWRDLWGGIACIHRGVKL